MSPAEIACDIGKSAGDGKRVQHNAAGRIVLEPKDKIKERLGASPDIADALALTFAAPIAIDQPALQSSCFAQGYKPVDVYSFGGYAG